MADISRIRVDSTTYDLKDARLPAPGADGTTLIADDGTWTVGTVGNDSPIVSGTGTGSARLLEGSNTASGTYSTAVGYGNMASDWYSYAEGRQNISDGQASHAEGAYTIAAGNFSHSEGRGNDPFTIRARSISDNNLTVYSINGASVGMYVSLGSDFSKITAVDTANDIVTLSDASWVPLYTDLNVMNTSAAGLCSHSEGYHTHANGDYSHAEGNSSSAIGNQSHTEGSMTQAIGVNSHSEGEATVANGESQHVQGKYNIEDTNGTYAHIVGNGSGSARSNAHTLDWSGNAWYAGTVSAGTVDSPATVTNNNDLTTKSYVDTALANSSGPFENGTNGIRSAKLRDFYYNSEWYRQTASGVGSFSSGSNTTASGKFSHAEGLGSTASGDASHAEGEATAQGYRSHAEGSATSIGINSHAEGFGQASGQASHAEGSGQTGASAYASHAEGSATHTDKSFAHSEGKNTIAHAEASHAEGYNGYTLGNYSHVEGVASNPINLTIASGSGTESDPYISQNISGSIKAGQLVVINENNYSWIESVNISAHSFTIENASSYTINAGDTVVVYVGCVASYGAHAEGDNTNAKGSNSHTEGSGTQTTGTGSHAEGSYTQAVGSYSHSEGSACVTNGAHSHAEGGNTKTSGYYSHAEGQYGIATGNASHVEGANTSINYDYISFSANVSGNTYTTASSIAVNNKLQVGCILSSSVNGSDGYTVTAIDRTNNTVTFSGPLPDLSRNYYIFCLAATGEGSHAEGKSVAIGKGSHAEGLNCYTYGHYAHAEGVGTIANSNYQHVDGQYNVADSSGIGTYVHITGIGSSESDRKNGFTINNVGNGWFAGNITANGGSLTLHDNTGDVTVTAAQLRQLLAMLS